jgi:hypothetical protein
MTRSVIAALLLVASATLALAATDDELKAGIVGTWGQDSACTTGTLTFNADGSFALARGDTLDTGTWQIADGVLSGTTSDGSSRPDVKLSIEGDNLVLGDMEGGRSETLTRCAS